MFVTIAMPAFDEAPNLARVAAEACTALSSTGHDGELLIVDDGSTDGTGGIADDLAKRDSRIRVIHHPTNRGFSGAMTTSLRAARGEWVFLVPADGQADMNDLSRFLAARAEADIVVGVRAHRAERAGRVLLSRAFHVIAKTAFPLPLAEFSSLFLFRRALIDGMPIRSRASGASFLPEVLFRAHSRHARFVQLIIEPRARLGGQAKGARLSVALQTLLELVRLAPLVRWDELSYSRRVKVHAAAR
jgi:glycosyltransferase involved in cell wall biosynthesis